MFKLVNFGRGVVGTCSFGNTLESSREYMKNSFGGSIKAEYVDDITPGNVYYIIEGLTPSGDMEISMRSDDLYESLLKYAKSKNNLELLK